MSNPMPFPEPCIVHLTDFDRDCAACHLEIGLISEQQQAVNREAVKVISTLEFDNCEVDPLVHYAVKLDTLIESIMHSNPKQRAKFDLVVATNVLNELVRQQSEVNRARLLGG